MTEQKDLLQSSNYNLNPQNLPNATAALVLGIISIIGSFCYGVVGLICGIIGLVIANKDRKLYQSAPELYSPASYGTLNAGRTCCIIGIVLSCLVIILVAIVIIFAVSMGSFKPAL